MFRNNSGCNGSTVSSSSLIENCSGNQICSDGECIKQEGSLPQSDPTATANILMILACPKDLCPNGKPITHNLGIGWFEDLANQLEDYYKTLSYDTEKLNVAVYPEWVMLPKMRGV